MLTLSSAAAIKGTTAGTPGSSAFTPNAAATGYRAWSNTAAGAYLVRYEDGAAWELIVSWWDGTSLSRSATQLLDSSTGSLLSLSSSATASLVASTGQVATHLGDTQWRVCNASTTGGFNSVGASQTDIGTGAAPTLGTTNLLTELTTRKYTSATTANAQAGFHTGANGNNLFVSSSAGRGGWEYVNTSGATTLPTGPRLFAGVSSTSFNGNTGEPSAFTAHVAAFACDSTDTNIQLLTNSNAGGGTKIDTGILYQINHVYRFRLWTDPGSTKVWGLLIDYTSGAIWLGSTTTDVPASGSSMMAQVLYGLSSTTGTAAVMLTGSLATRNGV